MQQIISLWTALDLRRRIIVVGATLAMFAAVLGLSQLATAPRMVLLYAGLDAATSGEVVGALDQQGVAYEIRGDAILVASADRDRLRMTLAEQGLPRNSGQGYELLDGLSGFGTTSQMFDAAYWRAKEGELARTILANPQIRAARVHIAQASATPFRKDQRPTASITVTTTSGQLSADQAKALRHLVAAAVPDLVPDAVAVIDSVGGLVPGEDQTGLPTLAADARAAEIRGNVERLLAARVGAGHAVVEVAVELVTEREEISEHRFDPQGRVAISTETAQKTSSNKAGSGDVTVASNLPEGAGSGAADQSQSSENTERTNFEVSETQRQVLRAPGDIRKISVAVMVDGEPVTDAEGKVTVTPRPEEELAILRELVSSAVGLDPARGDVLTLKSLAFEATPASGTEATSSLLPEFGPVDTMGVLQIAVLALVSLLLGLFVLRPVLLSARRPAAISASPPPLALPGTTAPPPVALTGEIADGDEMLTLADVSAAPEAPPTDPVARLRRLIELRQAESIEILRSWMEVEEEKT